MAYHFLQSSPVNIDCWWSKVQIHRERRVGCLSVLRTLARKHMLTTPKLKSFANWFTGIFDTFEAIYIVRTCNLFIAGHCGCVLISQSCHCFFGSTCLGEIHTFRLCGALVQAGKFYLCVVPAIRQRSVVFFGFSLKSYKFLIMQSMLDLNT